MTLKNKKYHLFILILFILNSCNKEKPIANKQHKIESFDITGNSGLETLQIVEDIEKTYIFILKNNEKKLLLKLYPLINNEFKTTNPTIENVYLEANNIQTNEKSLRVIVRNTDIQPDYYFIDVFLNCDEPKINNLGFMNSIDSVYIKNKKVNYLLKNVLDVNDGLNIREFTKNHFRL